MEIQNMVSEKNIPNSSFTRYSVLTIDQFKIMDRMAIDEYHLPIELMMENAGLQLARLIAGIAGTNGRILIGAGTGNNGGGGLVAAGRLAGWGYTVGLDIPDSALKSLPALQMKRAIASGATIGRMSNPDLFVDAYFGFSQRLPLPATFQEAIEHANSYETVKISLDLPSGFDRESGNSLFIPHIILTLAAPKKELLMLNPKPELYVADIGIPRPLYDEFKIPQPAFQEMGYLKIND